MKSKTWKPGDPIAPGPLSFESKADRQAYGKAVQDEIQRSYRRAQIKRARQQRGMKHGR